MKIKIQGGTAEFGQPSLCQSCKAATIVRGVTDANQIVRCDNLETRIDFVVTSCSQYVHKNHPAVWEMEEIAWVLKTDLKRNRIGFVRPSARRVILED